MPKKTLNVHVSTMDTELEFEIERKSTGKQLFELVTRTIGVREVWYFGLKYKDDQGFTTWLKDDKKIIDQNMPKQTILEFHFRVKFFPEDVGDELIQEVTQHLFYLQVKDEILCGDIYCLLETAVLLTSYAIQSKYGDFDPEIHQPGFLYNEKLIPQPILDVHTDFTQMVWEEGITKWYVDHKGMLREEAELEYLKIAQALDKYGVHYFEIKKERQGKCGAVWLIGIAATGMNLYKHFRTKPTVSYPWTEIKRVSYNGKKVTVTQIDKNAPNFIFYVSNARVSDLIVDLCIGHNEMYHRRRRADTLEVQQMKANAKQKRAKKAEEKLIVEKKIDTPNEGNTELEINVGVEMKEQCQTDKTETSSDSEVPWWQKTIEDVFGKSQEDEMPMPTQTKHSEENTQLENEDLFESPWQALIHTREITPTPLHLDESVGKPVHSDVLHNQIPVQENTDLLDEENEIPDSVVEENLANRGKEQKAIDMISQMIEEQVGSEIQATKEKEMKAQELRRQLEETKLVVEAAKMKLLEATGGPETPPRPTASVTPADSGCVDGLGPLDDNQLLLSPEWVGAPHGEAELNHDGAKDSEQPSSQLKRDRTEYQQKYKDISEKLKVLKTEMDNLKREDKVSKHYKLLHEGNIKCLVKLTLLLSEIK